MSESRFTQKGTILYGMKNAGKTTLGKRLAKDLHQPFVDTDDLITAKYFKHPVEIIRNPRLNLRTYQRHAILSHVPSEPEVIATGGSAALDPEVVSHLGQFGVGIFIDVDNDDLANRFIADEMDELYNPDQLTFNSLCDQRREVYRDVSDYTLFVNSGESVQAVSHRLFALRCQISA